MKRTLLFLFAWPTLSMGGCLSLLERADALHARFLSQFQDLRYSSLTNAELIERVLEFSSKPETKTEIEDLLQTALQKAEERGEKVARQTLSHRTLGDFEAVRWTGEGPSALAQFASGLYSPRYGFKNVAYSPVIGIYTLDGGMLDGIHSLYIDTFSVEAGRPSPTARHERVHAHTKRSFDNGIDHAHTAAIRGKGPISDMVTLPQYESPLQDEPIAYLETLYWIAVELEDEIALRGFDGNRQAARFFGMFKSLVSSSWKLTRQEVHLLRVLDDPSDEEAVSFQNLETERLNARTTIVGLDMVFEDRKVTYPIIGIDAKLVELAIEMKRVGDSRSPYRQSRRPRPRFGRFGREGLYPSVV